MTFCVRSTQVLLQDSPGPMPALLVVSDGKFESVEPYDAKPPANVIDVGDHLILPGIVDTHAHINEPGRTQWEGFQTATRAAAAGGITTVVDMPLNSIPATVTLEALKTKAASAEGQCMIDYGFWGGVIPGNAGELSKMVDHGALGFKCFLIDSGVSEFPMSVEEDLRQAMPILKKKGVPLLVHAELESPTADLSKADPTAYDTFLKSRPEKWEVDAIQMVIRLSRETGCPVHIVHLSAASALPIIRQAQEEGVLITVETCPHYLHFQSEKIVEGATDFKCCPPIRGNENREKLWKAVRNGTIGMLVSDHSPCTPSLKKFETGDFMQAWGGIAGLQFSLSVIWTEMRARKMTIAELSRRMSSETAKLAGLSDSKGAIAEGMDADFIVFDPEAEVLVQESAIQHRHKVTPYKGEKLYGKVVETYLRGEAIYSATQSEAKFPGKPRGQFLKRSRQGKEILS